MLIPRSCLVADDKVVLKNQDAIDTVLLKTGIVSNDWIEVLSGLKMTDKIVKQ